MAINLTYDPSDDPMVLEADQARDAENLAIGEDLSQQQDELLAGKYKDAEELERAYLELQSKLGGRSKDEAAEPEEDEQLDETVEEDASTAELLYEAARQYQETGEITEDLAQYIQSLDPKDIIEAFSTQEQQGYDLDESEVEALQGIVGGPQEYQALVQWAGQNLSEGEIEAFDNVINTGNPEAIYFAIQALQSRFNDSNGYDGSMLQGKAASSVDAFRSQAEVVRAMSDPRYDNDPAYRQDVYDKLERSNLQF